MRRRDFVGLVGGAAAWPLAARARQRKLPTIGYLHQSTAALSSQETAAFLQRLRELGWIEGRTVAIESRYAEGRSERLAEFAAEFVRLKVDVIVATSTPPAGAAKRATAVIPIIGVALGDPVGSGLVASLARPGGNVTGLSTQAPDFAGKKVELLREVIPTLRHLAVLVDFSNDDRLNSSVTDEVRAAARTLGIEVVPMEIRRFADIAPAFEALKGRAEAIFVTGSPLIITNRAGFHTLTMGARLPAIYNSRHYVEAGGLMSYGPNAPHFYRRAAEFVDKILRGTQPADIAVEQPTRFELIVNLTTAKALGLTIPETLLATADEVIQ
jgi:putative tryptophan/tyrosine transport system substrate-binding protein